MKSNRVLMFLILIEIAFLKITVGNQEERARCIRHLQNLCGAEKPNVDDCGKWGVLKYSHHDEQLPDYIHNYFSNDISVNMTAPKIKIPSRYCRERAIKQIETKSYDMALLLEIENKDPRKRLFENFKEWKISKKYYEEGSTSQGEGRNLSDPDIQKLLIKLKAMCMEKLYAYPDKSIDEIIAYSLLCVYEDNYTNPYNDFYEDNMIAREYLIHVSEHVVVSNLDAREPLKFCGNLERRKGRYLPNEMFPCFRLKYQAPQQVPAAPQQLPAAPQQVPAAPQQNV